MNDQPERPDQGESPRQSAQPITVERTESAVEKENPTDSNPYAPARTITGDEPTPGLAAGDLDPPPPKTPLQTIGIWMVVCGVAAIPSFWIGLGVSGGEIAGMVTGILIFAGIYSWLDLATRHWNWRKHASVRSTLRWTYGIRLVASVLFPLGIAPDMMCGIIAVETAQVVCGVDLMPMESNFDFFPTLITTLIQGVLLNCVLAVLACLIQGLRLGIRAVWAKTA